MTRGFITIATGRDQYYEMAKNLVLSYRLFCGNPCPFATGKTNTPGSSIR